MAWRTGGSATAACLWAGFGLLTTVPERVLMASAICKETPGGFIIACVSQARSTMVSVRDLMACPECRWRCAGAHAALRQTLSNVLW